ncbi:MAG: helix-turn-helix domain-containing protein [Phenylobacterium sp.]|uniref:transcriptional regulator n=1 Tax=Phenylobacterium sp. TaxID=1871053 RepID=UPI001A4D1385|nr:transcriptional regulator [Phenylobacterium sp.]MBL8773352.1 helix-turn-helix domain-containing protein [Phenylobacterium sp.]
MRDKRGIHTPAQCRAARALLGLTADDLARRARLTIDVVAAFEAGGDIELPARAALENALRECGVIGIAEAAAGEGVRFSRPATDPARRAPFAFDLA